MRISEKPGQVCHPEALLSLAVVDSHKYGGNNVLGTVAKIIDGSDVWQATSREARSSERNTRQGPS